MDIKLTSMMTESGIVLWYNRHFGYGFIGRNTGEQVFFHHTVVDGGVARTTARSKKPPVFFDKRTLSKKEFFRENNIPLRRGDKVTFKAEATQLGWRATKVFRYSKTASRYDIGPVPRRRSR